MSSESVGNARSEEGEEGRKEEEEWERRENHMAQKAMFGWL